MIIKRCIGFELGHSLCSEKLGKLENMVDFGILLIEYQWNLGWSNDSIRNSE